MHQIYIHMYFNRMAIKPEIEIEIYLSRKYVGINTATVKIIQN